MGRRNYKPEEIIAHLREIEVRLSNGGSAEPPEFNFALCQDRHGRLHRDSSVEQPHTQ